MYEVTGDRPSGLVVCEAMTVLRSLAGVCERYGINLAAEYEREMAYNWTRPYQHGGRTLSDAEASSTGRGE